MKRSTYFKVITTAVILALTAGNAAAERPRVYALTNAKIVVAPGRTIEKGAIVLRDGLIEAVGAKINIPPDAVEVDASGKIIYPGLIDAHTQLGLRRAQPSTAPETGRAADLRIQVLTQRRETPPGAVHPLSRVRPETQTRHLIAPFEGDNKEAERYRNLGITTALVAPESGIFRGESALINLRDGAPTSELILKERAAQHVALETGGFAGGGGYPTSLMGVTAAFRQVLLDADRYLTWKKRYAAQPTGMKRPEHSAAYEALAPVLERRQPVIFEIDNHQNALLADRLAREFNLKAVIAGTGTEWERLEEIKATGRTLILPVSIPDKPKVEDPDDALEVDVRELRRFVHAPENLKRLHEAGLRFALTTHGLKILGDFPKNMRKFIGAGLPFDVALAAWTTVPAELFGVSNMLGSLEPGKIANLLVAGGELFGEKTKIQQIFVDGYEYKTEEDRKPKGDPTAVVDARGTWSVITEFGGGRSMTSTWKIKGAPGQYTGTVESPRGTVEFSGVQLEGNALTVTMPGFGRQGSTEMTVIITGDSFEGSAAQGPMTITVKGSRTEGPQGGLQ